MPTNELFNRTYAVPPARLLQAVEAAVAELPSTTLQEVDEDGEAVAFTTSLTLTSWGEHMRAVVEPAEAGGAVVRVSGTPRVGLLSTPWGEEVHAAQVEQQLFAALDGALAVEAAGGGAGPGAAEPASAQRVREVMTADVEVVGLDTTIEDAAVLLAAAGIGAVPVCDEGGRLRAILTDRDIVVGVVAQARDPRSTTVGEAVDGGDVVTIGADDTVGEALEAMEANHVRRLPVVDGDQLVGMVSQGDLARHLPPAEVGELVERISAAPGD